MLDKSGEGGADAWIRPGGGGGATTAGRSRRARGAPWSSSSATTSAVRRKGSAIDRAGRGGVGGHELAVALADQQVAGGEALRVELGEAVEGRAVGATGGSDDDGWIEAGHVLAPWSGFGVGCRNECESPRAISSNDSCLAVL